MSLGEKLKDKSLVVKIITYVAIGIFVVGVIASIIALNVKLNNSITTVKVSASAYSVGMIDDTTGKTPTEQENIAIYTKNYLPVNGLKCQIAAGSNIRYQVNFYDADHYFLGVKTYTTDYITLPSEQTFATAKYAKIEIFPTADEDGTVTALEISKYAKMLTVTYNK